MNSAPLGYRNERGDAFNLEVAVVLVDAGKITPYHNLIWIDIIKRDESLQRAAHDLVLGVVLVVR